MRDERRMSPTFWRLARCAESLVALAEAVERDDPLGSGVAAAFAKLAAAARPSFSEAPDVSIEWTR
jgi:hypothetical protein